MAIFCAADGWSFRVCVREATVADPTPETLLALLAVKLLGGNNVPKRADALKALNKFIPQAVMHGWLVECKVHPLNKKGRPGAAVAALSITPAGEEYLRLSSSPEATIAVAHAKLAEMRQSLDADRTVLREQVLAAVKPPSEGGAKVTKEIAALTKAVSGIADRLTTLEATLTGTPVDAVLSKIDESFRALVVRLEQVSTPAPRAPLTSGPTPAPGRSLRDVLYAAYEKLTRFVEFQDGLVEIPRLYHEAKRAQPDLTVSAMHRELNALWEARELELQVLNEVHQATEPDKGIWHNDKLLYYVFWKRS
jgi:hypothetical protein